MSNVFAYWQLGKVEYSSKSRIYPETVLKGYVILNLVDTWHDLAMGSVCTTSSPGNGGKRETARTIKTDSGHKLYQFVHSLKRYVSECIQEC